MYSKKLKEIRDEKGLKQKDIAKILSIEYSTYSVYEVEINILPIKYMNVLANYFNVSIDYLFSLSTKKKYSNTNSEINIELSGKRLLEFRKSLKYTQDKLASILNVNRSTIAYYEKGKNIIATPFLYSICTKYKVSADYLLGKIDEPKYLK